MAHLLSWGAPAEAAVTFNAMGGLHVSFAFNVTWKFLASVLFTIVSVICTWLATRRGNPIGLSMHGQRMRKMRWKR